MYCLPCLGFQVQERLVQEGDQLRERMPYADESQLVTSWAAITVINGKAVCLDHYKEELQNSGPHDV